MVFSGVSFSFLHCSSSTPAIAICFGAQAFSHMGVGREGEEDCGICFGAQALIVVVCWWVQGDDMACHM